MGPSHSPPNRPPTDFGLPSGYPTNPYLTYRPIFARSLPIQLLVTGITLTLVSVLLIQLLFSAPSHIRIARTNFFLQVSAALSLLAWEIASITLILNASRDQSQNWPFMLDYVAFDLPPLNDPRTHGSWSTGGLTAWLFMNAVVSVLTQATHIHFLTLMYPSRLEAQLIFILLGPLAIVAALTQFAALKPHLDFVSATSSVRNVCNATLTILFSISLAVWGFVVNRKQAWRTDGGTAAFGVGAIILALASTAITIAYIPSRDQYEWVPGLTGAIVLWQSFLGWWWWVGAGMGISEVDEWLKRAEKRRKRRIARQARRAERKIRFLGAWNTMTGGARATSASSTALERTPSDMNAVPEGNNVGSDTDSLPPSSRSDDTSTKGQPPDNRYRQAGWYWPWNLMWITYRHIRNAHISAARRRALERSEHIRESFGVDGLVAHVPATSGWNLGSFGVREREAREAAFEMEGVERLVRRSRGGATAVAGMTEPEGEEEGEWKSDQGARARRCEIESHRQAGTGQTPVETHSSSPWWWGPLRRWRLQDTTEYSERH
ncbi:hypothetical protein F5888DRAFT_1302028 [Russula emetica]|nr:hypothetical protein F5888DRAFT_1302028 [Russula emetica]